LPQKKKKKEAVAGVEEEIGKPKRNGILSRDAIIPEIRQGLDGAIKIGRRFSAEIMTESFKKKVGRADEGIIFDQKEIVPEKGAMQAGEIEKPGEGGKGHEDGDNPEEVAKVGWFFGRDLQLGYISETGRGREIKKPFELPRRDFQLFYPKD